MTLDRANYSIGELADRTGINPDTIRVWERRYGRPIPVRLPSGHRRYAESELQHLRRVAEAMARGHRPSKLLALSDSELDAILATDVEQPSRNETSLDFESLLASIRGFRREALRAELIEGYEQSDPLEYLDQVMTPIMTMVGRKWADGDLAVRHEHFLSETIEDVLRTMRMLIEDKRDRADIPSPLMVLATLPGERHDIGLQMVALTSALCGRQVHNLGVEVPLVEIEETMRETGAKALGLSISLATGGVQSDRLVRSLRASLPIEVAILVGGAGARRARRGVQGVQYYEELGQLAVFLRQQSV